MTEASASPVRSVQTTPDIPVMVFDGDCRFCRMWIERWRQRVGDQVKFVPFQDPWVKETFPDLPQEQCEKSVQFIDTAGQVNTGARAAFQCLAAGGRFSLGWWAYAHVPGFAPASEMAYRFVAGHRQGFSFLTRLGWGAHVERPGHALVRRVFLIAIALVYGCAFSSLWFQILGLAGSNGVMPAAQMMEALQQQAEAGQLGWTRYGQSPTLFWCNASDGFLQFICGCGTGLSLLVLVGIAPRICLALLWFFYLSLLQICPLFLGYQWDVLLLETGLLAIFFAPGRLWTWRKPQDEPSRVVLWLLRWLLFRLMFRSGCVKLLSGDVTWHELSALTFHYETQPLPTWIGWYAHQLPAWAQTFSTLLMFGIELIVPFCIFLPRRIRMAAGWLMIGFMGLIALTGNYCFFNILTAVLCLTLFDDQGLRALVPSRWRRSWASAQASDARAGDRERFSTDGIYSTIAFWRQICGKVAVGFLAAIIGVVTLEQLASTFNASIPCREMAKWVHRQVAPLASVNNYGLFAVMTTNRMEIVIEGSTDGQTWAAYEFKHKPGALDRRPGFVAPHQPRLDWQMWFAALSTYRNNPWLINLCVRLLEGAPEVLRLLDANPFPESPPKFIRASMYAYHFTTMSERAQSGQWWKREPRGLYLPAFSLR